jgi:HD-GYP domain-containing protein (c-di-GMP phosphodiesterase class II)
MCILYLPSYQRHYNAHRFDAPRAGGRAVSHAPRFATRALLASFCTVGVILIIVFVLITVDVRARAREAVIMNLDAGQQVAARVEDQRRQELLATVTTLAENPTLKAAIDTWQAERTFGGAHEEALLATVQREAEKIADRVNADVLALLDPAGRIITSAGSSAAAWARGLNVQQRNVSDPPEFIAQLPDGAFRVIGVPLRFGDAVIGSIELGRAINAEYARELADLVRGHSAIVIDSATTATTLSPAAAADLVAIAGLGQQAAATVDLGGESYALRHLYDVPPARIFTLASIDVPAKVAIDAALRRVTIIGVIAVGLAAVGSLWLAHAMTRPIGELSNAVTQMTVARRFSTPLPTTGRSRELDALATTFNDLMAAVAEAEADTQEAYLGAIRALVAALDARDPYTAGHSERVSALSVAIGKAMAVSDQELDTLRLGALLHDIGKIGVPDDVLGKPGALTPDEFALIQAHPLVGARILRSIPFLAPHLPIVELHHERPDGRGYPYGLRGNAIPLAARIVHVADAYDAMTTARAYRPARLPQEALAELHRGSGTDFDTGSVDALVRALGVRPAPVSTPVRPRPAAVDRYAS